MTNVIVTGAAGDIGSELCKQGRAAGYGIIGADKKAGGDVCYLNIVSSDSISKFFRELNELDDFPSVLVNNAGRYIGKNIADYSSEQLVDIINVNIAGTMLMTQAFVQHLVSKDMSGKVINISSIAGVHGGSDAVYAATKSSLIGLTKSSLGENVTSYCVAPGLVKESEMESEVPSEKLVDYENFRVSRETVADQIVTLIGDNHGHKNGDLIEIYSD